MVDDRALRRTAAPLRRLAVLGAAAAVTLAGCSSGPGGGSVPTRVPATPAQAAAPVAHPAGQVAATAAHIRSTLFDPVTHSVVALATDPDRLLVFPAGDLSSPRALIPLPAGAGAPALTGGGHVLVPRPGGLTSVDLKTGATDDHGLPGDFSSVTALPDGGYAAGTAQGDVLILRPDFTIAKSIGGFVSADGLAATKNGLAVLDRHQTSITELDLQDGSKGPSLRVGKGATNLTVDHFGRVLVTDTAGGQLLVYTLDPLMARQQFPVGPSPFAVAYDDRSDTAWVTTTGDDQVAGYDLSTGIPVEKARFSTVGQPDSLAVDSSSGMLYVSSANGGGIQTIATRRTR